MWLKATPWIFVIGLMTKKILLTIGVLLACAIAVTAALRLRWESWDYPGFGPVTCAGIVAEHEALNQALLEYQRESRLGGQVPPAPPSLNFWNMVDYCGGEPSRVILPGSQASSGTTWFVPWTLWLIEIGVALVLSVSLVKIWSPTEQT